MLKQSETKDQHMSHTLSSFFFFFFFFLIKPIHLNVPLTPTTFNVRDYIDYRIELS